MWDKGSEVWRSEFLGPSSGDHQHLNLIPSQSILQLLRRFDNCGWTVKMFLNSFWSINPFWCKLSIHPLHVRLQYVFVSLLSRDSVYDVLRRICTHLQVCGSPVWWFSPFENHCHPVLSRTGSEESTRLTVSLAAGEREESESEAVPGGTQLSVHGNVAFVTYMKETFNTVGQSVKLYLCFSTGQCFTDLKVMRQQRCELRVWD